MCVVYDTLPLDTNKPVLKEQPLIVGALLFLIVIDVDISTKLNEYHPGPVVCLNDAAPETIFSGMETLHFRQAPSCPDGGGRVCVRQKINAVRFSPWTGSIFPTQQTLL